MGQKYVQQGKRVVKLVSLWSQFIQMFSSTSSSTKHMHTPKHIQTGNCHLKQDKMNDFINHSPKTPSTSLQQGALTRKKQGQG